MPRPCRYLEDELAARYRDAAPGTLALLQDRCGEVSLQLQAAEAQLAAANDVAFLRRAGAPPPLPPFPFTLLSHPRPPATA